MLDIYVGSTCLRSAFRLVASVMSILKDGVCRRDVVAGVPL